MGRIGFLFDEDRSQKIVELCERLGVDPHEFLSLAVDKMADVYKNREAAHAERR
jgi:hypothetical protein